MRRHPADTIEQEAADAGRTNDIQIGNGTEMKIFDIKFNQKIDEVLK